MAWTEVQCAECGSPYQVQMYGPNRERRRRAQNWKGVCEECKTRKREEEHAQAIEWARENDMPELSGSEKQIRWAETIRKRRVEAAQDMITPEKNSSPYFSAREMVRAGYMEQIGDSDFAFTRLGERCFGWICSQDKAKYWIEGRDLSLEQMFREAARILPDEEAKDDPDAIQDLTLRPEEPITETLAEIVAPADYVLIKFPEKRKDFRDLVKFDLDYRWTGQAWKLKVGVLNSPIEDRIVEAGHRLLSAGFCVVVHDDTLRERIVSADYTPAPTRWVSKRTSGECRGWFAIGWDRRKDEDLYREAKLLPASKYDKPDVVIPPEHYEEVMDFAETNGLFITPGARDLAAKAEERKMRSVTAEPADPPEDKKPRPGQRPNLDDKAEGPSVDPSLKD